MTIVLVFMLVGGISALELLPLIRERYWKESIVYVSLILTALAISVFLLLDLHVLSPADMIEQILIRLFDVGGKEI